MECIDHGSATTTKTVRRTTQTSQESVRARAKHYGINKMFVVFILVGTVNIPVASADGVCKIADNFDGIIPLYNNKGEKTGELIEINNQLRSEKYLISNLQALSDGKFLGFTVESRSTGKTIGYLVYLSHLGDPDGEDIHIRCRGGF